MREVLEYSKKRRKSWQGIEKERLWEERRDWRQFVYSHIKWEKNKLCRY
jgi:hypothetical protein